MMTHFIFTLENLTSTGVTESNVYRSTITKINRWRRMGIKNIT